MSPKPSRTGIAFLMALILTVAASVSGRLYKDHMRGEALAKEWANLQQTEQSMQYTEAE